MERQKYHSVIWDWNGTLLNDVWLCVQIVNKLLKEQNLSELDESTYKDVFGFPIIDYYTRIGIDLERESFESLTKKFISGYDAGVRTCALHQHVLHTLATFEKLGVQQFILTAAHKESVLGLLDFNAIRPYFIDVEGLDNHRAESKIDRGHQLVENHNLDRRKTLLIGDTIHDLDVANEMGIDCMLVARGHQSKERLQERAEPQMRVLDHLGQLMI